MAKIDSTSMKVFISNRILKKLSFFNNMLCPTNIASMSLVVCQINIKMMYTFFTTGRDQKHNTYIMLLSLAALSILTFRVGGRRIPRDQRSSAQRSADMQVSAPCRTTSKIDDALNPTDSSLVGTTVATQYLAAALQKNPLCSLNCVQKYHDHQVR